MGNTESADSSRYLARFAAFVAVAVGLFVYFGWVFGVEQLTNLVPDWPRMSRLTALAFVLAGGGLWLAAADAKRFAMITALLLVAVGLLVLFRYAFNWVAYVDQLTLAPMPVLIEGDLPPRMAPSTAIAFCLFGLSLIFSLLERTPIAHQILAILSMVVGWLGLSRYIYGGEALVPFVNMAAHASIVFLLLTAGALTLRPDAGIARLLANDGVGGAMARRLLPAAVIVPLAAGALTLNLERRESFGLEAAVSVLALLSVVVFVTFVWVNAARGDRADRLRRKAEHDLQLSEERNQLIVATSLDAVVTMNSAGVSRRYCRPTAANAAATSTSQSSSERPYSRSSRPPTVTQAKNAA